MSAMKFFCWLSAFAALLATSLSIQPMPTELEDPNRIPQIIQLKEALRSIPISYDPKTEIQYEQNEWYNKLYQFLNEELNLESLVTIEIALREYNNFVKQRDQAAAGINNALDIITSWYCNPDVPREIKYALIDFEKKLKKVARDGNAREQLHEIAAFQIYIDEVAEPNTDFPFKTVNEIDVLIRKAQAVQKAQRSL